MKVVYFSQDYTPHDYRFLQKLGQTGYEVWYLRFETSPTPLETRPLPLGVKEIDWMGSHPPEADKLGWWGKLKLFLSLRQVLRQVQPDLVHAGPIQTCGFFTALAGFKPMLLMSWGSDILTVREMNVIRRWLTRFTIRRAAVVAADCLAVRDMVVKLAGYPVDKIIVFPWGVDLNQFTPAPSPLGLRQKFGWENNKIIISTRSFEPIYGTEVFLEAAKEVVTRAPQARILMLGGGSLQPKVNAFITQHHLEHAIRLVGRVQHDLLPAYFNEADLYVSSSYSDGTSISLLEAMACRLPVVVTDLPSNREWVTPGVNGWLVPAGDAVALTSAILEALADGDKARNMAKANLSIARNRADWNKNFNVLLEAYRRLAGDK